MTPEQQRIAIAIAEACAWKYIDNRASSGKEAAMSDRATPETDAEWDRLQMLPGGGYSSTNAGINLAFGMAAKASQLERQRDEARELALVAVQCLRGIIADLPKSRDWLNPDLEKVAKALLIKAKEVLG